MLPKSTEKITITSKSSAGYKSNMQITLGNDPMSTEESVIKKKISFIYPRYVYSTVLVGPSIQLTETNTSN